MNPLWNAVRRNAPGFVGFLALALLLASCVTISAESEFHEDGSASHVYEFTMEKALLSEAGEDLDLDLEGDFQEMEEQLRDTGYVVDWIDTDEHIGSRVSITAEDGRNVGEALNGLFSVGADGGEQPVNAFLGAFEQDGNAYTLDLTVDSDSLFAEELDGDQLGGGPDMSAAMLGSMIEMTYTVRLPGEIDLEETNGQMMEDGRVQWDIPLSGSTAFLAVSETEGDDASTLLILGGVGLLLLLAVGAAAAGLVLMRRKPAPVAAPAYADPGTPAPVLPED